MGRRIACLFSTLLLCTVFLTGCEERQIYPLSEVREEDLAYIVVDFPDEKWDCPLYLAEDEAKETVEVLQGLRMTTQVKRASISSRCCIVLQYTDGQSTEIKGDAESFKIGSSYYLWPWASWQKFDNLSQKLYGSYIKAVEEKYGFEEDSLAEVGQ